MKNQKIISIITVAIKNSDRFLLMKKTKPDLKISYGFLSENFDENLNGDLDDTVKRVLNKILNDVDNLFPDFLYYIGSFMRVVEDIVSICYDFVFDLKFDANVLGNNYMWVPKSELSEIELDQKTNLFLEMHDDLL